MHSSIWSTTLRTKGWMTYSFSSWTKSANVSTRQPILKESKWMSARRVPCYKVPARTASLRGLWEGMRCICTCVRVEALRVNRLIYHERDARVSNTMLCLTYYVCVSSYLCSTMNMYIGNHGISPVERGGKRWINCRAWNGPATWSYAPPVYPSSSA